MLILNHLSAEQLVRKNPNQLNVISVERNCFVPPELCKNHLHLKFDDLNDFHFERWKKDLFQYIFPEKEHILLALEFDKFCGGKIDIIHCHAGISRSPAIAYAIFRGRGFDKQQSLDRVMKIQPDCEPNRRIIRLTEEILNKYTL